MDAPQQASGLPDTAYYAPAFVIEVEGEVLSPETNGDVLDLKVSMAIDNMSSFQLKVANWDDRNLFFKYSDSHKFDPGSRVHIRMGYADRLASMFRGQITRMNAAFPDSGTPTLDVSGQDGLFRLKDQKREEGEITKYVNKTDSEIAEAVAARNGMRSKVTPSNIVHPEVVQKNQDDARFLIERATRIDFDCYVHIDPQTGEDTLFFVKPTDGRDASAGKQYVLSWGRDLISFTPTVNLTSQVAKVTVRGWDPATKKPIVFTAEPKDLPFAEGGDSGPEMADKTQPDKKEVIVDAPVKSEQEARTLAISLLTERAYRFVTARGQIIGLPDLRPGENLELQGLGNRFNGAYHVRKVEHSIGANGYRTEFEGRRLRQGEVA
ncbi:MAG: hypothetical protein WBP89_14925 [Sedimenticolaceae bacterium]